jgi:hypothetical protein
VLESNRKIGAIIGLAAALVYLLFPTRNYYWDGLTFALEIETVGQLSPSLFHANHLLYNVFGYAAYAAANGLGIDARAIAVLQALNAVLGGAAAYALFQILWKIKPSLYRAATLTLLFAFSATWWKFSSDANSYTVSTLLLLIAFYLVLPGRRPAPVWVAIFHMAAMLMHQLAVFFVPAAAVGLYYQSKHDGDENYVKVIFKYLAISGLSTLAVYYLAFNHRTGLNDPGSFLMWISSYSSGSGGFTFDVLKNLEHTVRGHIRLFVGGRFNLFNENVTVLTVGLAATSLIAAFALALQMFLGRRDLRALGVLLQIKRWPAVAVIAALWMVPYLVFCFFFYPQDTFHRLIYFPAIIILIAAASSAATAPRRRYRLALLVSIVVTANFLFSIYPYSFTRNETPLAMAEKMQSIWSDKTVVFYQQFTGDDTTLKYFNPRSSWQKLPAAAEEAERAILDALRGGNDVWLETTAIERFERTPGGLEQLAARTLEHHKVLDPAYNLRLVRLRQ